MILAATGCTCVVGGITSLDHPSAKLRSSTAMTKRWPWTVRILSSPMTTRLDTTPNCLEQLLYCALHAWLLVNEKSY
jgi:hypothetical protein